MPHIQLPDDVPGIRSLVMYRPDTGKPLYDLAQVLLRGDSPLSTAERELIATYVSARNHCNFCTQSHEAAARALFGDEREVVDFVLNEYETAPVSDKMKALLTIAGRVQTDARTVSDADVTRAREHGATDRDIHDTVLIAATFCMFNRYVDGLATLSPTDSAVYEPMGERLAQQGYALPNPAPQL
ncbi:carboxymuconolactone decarboxylase family protein [Spirosoma spitsbergense]|uniref:carboxymuconolactone decarboxylase family protein n=1 Tax=Spirosoma spitsbergense TaxID=431554 RepID=UPI0003806B33|nr:peroxidase-related enzyme [Spirosoma spitsbergense]